MAPLRASLSGAEGGKRAEEKEKSRVELLHDSFVSLGSADAADAAPLSGSRIAGPRALKESAARREADMPRSSH